jgi:hypothetical protein
LVGKVGACGLGSGDGAGAGRVGPTCGLFGGAGDHPGAGDGRTGVGCGAAGRVGGSCGPCLLTCPPFSPSQRQAVPA